MTDETGPADKPDHQPPLGTTTDRRWPGPKGPVEYTAHANWLVLRRKEKPAAEMFSVSYLAATPTPRLVRLVITSGGLDSVATAGVTRQGQHYVFDVRIGGLGGIISTAIRKSLPRSHIWISTGIPGFLRAETPLGVDGPTWRIDLAAPGSVN